jgi:hypothetical protein
VTYLAGALLLVKATNAFCVLLYCLYVGIFGRRPRIRWLDVAVCAAPLLLFAGVAIWYNWARFGDPLDFGYARDQNEKFSTPILEGSFGLLFSPYKGLFWFNPALAQLVWTAGGFWKSHRREAAFINWCIGMSFGSFWHAVELVGWRMLGTTFPGTDPLPVDPADSSTV